MNTQILILDENGEVIKGLYKTFDTDVDGIVLQYDPVVDIALEDVEAHAVVMLSPAFRDIKISFSEVWKNLKDTEFIIIKPIGVKDD